MTDREAAELAAVGSATKDSATIRDYYHLSDEISKEAMERLARSSA